MELAEVSEAKPHALDTEIRQLDAGLIPQSGASAISNLLLELQYNQQQNYIVIDLGSESSPQWLTSRLYLLALLITPINRPLRFVFVETVGNVRRSFIGLAAPDRVRRDLARRYTWLESASAASYAIVGGLYCDPASGLQLNPAAAFQFDPATGYLVDWQTTQFVQEFLQRVRLPQIPPNNLETEASEWVVLANSAVEHAKWLDGARVERLLGTDLDRSQVVLLPNKTVNDLSEAVLKQQGQFVAVVEPDKMFRCVVDRLSVLESLASQFMKQTTQSN